MDFFDSQRKYVTTHRNYFFDPFKKTFFYKRISYLPKIESDASQILINILYVQLEIIFALLNLGFTANFLKLASLD